MLNTVFFLQHVKCPRVVCFVTDGAGPVNDLGDNDPRAREPRVASGGVNVFQRIKVSNLYNYCRCF